MAVGRRVNIGAGAILASEVGWILGTAPSNQWLEGSVSFLVFWIALASICAHDFVLDGFAGKPSEVLTTYFAWQGSNNNRCGILCVFVLHLSAVGVCFLQPRLTRELLSNHPHRAWASGKNIKRKLQNITIVCFHFFSLFLLVLLMNFLSWSFTSYYPWSRSSRHYSNYFVDCVYSCRQRWPR